MVEDLFRLPELTHVVIVSGDSDFIALAQRCRRLGRYVVGIGVAGGTSRALNAACNEYKDYDGLLNLTAEDAESETAALTVTLSEPPVIATPSVSEPAPAASAPAKAAAPKTATPKKAAPAQKPSEQLSASTLLRRALALGESKDQEWTTLGAVKNQMLRINPTFQESALGFKNFTEFVKSRGNMVELKEGPPRMLRLRATATKGG